MNPSKVQARKMVLVSAFALALIVSYRKGSSADSFRRLWGVGVVSLLLSLLADFAPTIAGPFAVLAVLGSLAKDPNLIDKALGGISGTGSSGQTTAASPARPAAAPGYTPVGGTR